MVGVVLLQGAVVVAVVSEHELLEQETRGRGATLLLFFGDSNPRLLMSQTMYRMAY